MKPTTRLLSVLTAVALFAPACSIVKKAARGEEISNKTLVDEHEKNEREAKRKADKIERIESQINDDLASYAELRQNGRFSSSDYREKRINKKVDELAKLDSSRPLVAAAPQKIAALKAEWTEERYKKEKLAEKCNEYAERAKKSRMEERWRGVERSITDYVKCRRKMKDAGVDLSVVASSDKAVVGEYDLYGKYLLGSIESYRKEQKFRYAVGMETQLEAHTKYYAELAPRSRTPRAWLKSMKKIQKQYRDPEEVKAERAKADFEAWSKRVTEAFGTEWEAIMAAEAKARPLYDEGKGLMASDQKGAIKKLLAARQTLYQAAYPSSVALDAAYNNGSLEKGLSYEIAAALAQIYFEQGAKAKLYPELSVIKTGRPWLDKDKEIQIRHYDILADRNGKLSPKPTDTVKRYAGRYSKTGKEFRAVKEVAEARRGEAYGNLGVEVETITHRRAASDAAKMAGKVVYMEAPVSAVAGNKLRFDFKSSYRVPTKCWRTNRVAGVNVYTGRVYYEQKCKYKKKKSGYVIVVPKPSGVSVRKGDIVSFYAAVGKRKGKFDVHLVKPGYVRVAPKGATKWFMGSKVK